MQLDSCLLTQLATRVDCFLGPERREGGYLFVYGSVHGTFNMLNVVCESMGSHLYVGTKDSAATATGRCVVFVANHISPSVREKHGTATTRTGAAFPGTSCPSESDPDFSVYPPSPLCHICS